MAGAHGAGRQVCQLLLQLPQPLLCRLLARLLRSTTCWVKKLTVQNGVRACAHTGFDADLMPGLIPRRCVH